MKRHWILALALAALSGIAACSGEEAGSGDEAPRVSIPTSPAGPPLARIGTIGDLPPAESSLVVDVAADGAISVAGDPLDFAGLSARVAARADQDREGGFLNASALHVVLRMDESLPWKAGQWLMMEFAKPDVRIYRIFFAVLPEEGEEEGALAAWLPMDRGLARSDNGAIGVGGGAGAAFGGRGGFGRKPATGPVKISLTGNGPVAGFDGLYHGLIEAFADTGGRAEIGADPFVPVGTVLRAADAAYRAGAVSITFRGTVPPTLPGQFAAFIASERPLMEATGTEIDGVPVTGDSPGPMPAVERVRGGFAGTLEFTAADLFKEEVKPLEDEEK